ncbi:restriction endonuclease subunit S [Nostocaceae cyanobacterium CENA369]|uniref:Restriction endonuclease subunit S n=1 Tax=Dendronalium phyllosphericum CENA369 TaxID=1725256 RepID=A0A8J7IQG3_9NOST|nr:restriction endonuclease subunit S [Dendronalium phyllosphericum]MBH8577232.1 restriction endonuclease subunit S [Dendronalium phyllosphericum CENA369]
MNELPEGWTLTKFMDVFDIQGGTQPPKSNFQYEPQPGYIQLLQIRDFGEHPVPTYIRDTHTIKRCTEQDILIARYGASLGRILTGLSGAYNVAMAKVDIPEAIDRRFVYHLLRSEIFQAPLRLVSRSAQNGFNKKDIAEIELPLAPLNEQKRIADKLDALLTRVDTCRERLERIPPILKRFRQAVLAAATSGQLTEDWREENFDIEPALVKKKTYSLAVSKEDLPLLPDTWEWVALGNYAQCSRGRFSVRPRNDPAYFNGEHPFIQIGDLPSEGGWITSHKQTVNEKGLAVSKKFPKGTVVIAIVGSTIGNTGILAYDMCFTDSMIGIDSGYQFSNRYIELFLRHRKEDIRRISYAGGGQPNIKLEVLNPYPFALPPLAEQRKIVCRVDALFAYINHLEAHYQAAHAQVERLTPALLAKAFRGELVPQDPNDESVSSLLEQIRTDRAAQPSKANRAMTSRKTAITKMTKESVKEAIRQLPKDKFSFDELRENLTGDYDSLKDILFTLLSEAEPILTQVFDQEERAMRFFRAGK